MIFKFKLQSEFLVLKKTCETNIIVLNLSTHKIIII